MLRPDPNGPLVAVDDGHGCSKSILDALSNEQGGYLEVMQ